MISCTPGPKSWLGAILALGAVVRLAAFTWNNRLFGDVNLYALVARRWSETGRLEYPGKFDYFDPAPYLALASPVTQHPPAWSWLAGLLTSAHLAPDEFTALKLLCLVFGLAVIVLGMGIARALGGNRAAVVTGLLLALHPMLVDYSANGSPYIAVAAGALAATYAALATERSAWARGALAGAGAAAAWNFHGVGMLLVPAGLAALALNIPRARRVHALGGFLVACGLLLIPLFAWNHANFGKILQSTSTFYVQGKLGLIRMTEEAGIIHYQVGELGWQHLWPYTLLALKSSLRFFLHLGLESGFAGLVLAGVACFALRKVIPRTRLAGVALVVFAITAPCLGWPEFKYRFLVPLLPFVIILAVIGWAELKLKRPPWLSRLLATGAMAGCAVFWIVQIALTGSPAKYYAYDLRHLRDYRLMRQAADFLRDRPPGVVLSFSDPLDGGGEAAWWHGKIIVGARGFPDARIGKLTADFKPSYLLLSPRRRELVATMAPGATLRFENAGYLVYECFYQASPDNNLPNPRSISP